MVELRLDALAEEDRLLPLHAPCPKPLLITPRHASEGGACTWHEADRRHLAEQLLPAAAALDWEIAHLPGADRLLQAAADHGVALIASAHYFHHTPPLEEMLQLADKAQAAGAAVVKIAFTPQCEADVATGLAFLQRCAMPAAAMGMGPLGPASRELYSRSGSCLLYGYLGSTPTAPGQLSARQCCAMLQHTAAC